MRHTLEVSDLTVTFGGIAAVNSVTFDLLDGQIIGLIGPNGAGKTTILDAISGFAPASGRVTLNRTNITHWNAARRAGHGLGRSFQDARLYPSLTVSEVLAISLERHHHVQDPISSALRMPWVVRAERRIRRRVEELIELMSLEAFRDKFVSELSTGTRRIVDLACILAHEPTVLLLDEPSSGIAQRETEALGPLLRRVQDTTGCSMLVVEHDMPLIAQLADKLIALELGRVISFDVPEKVLNDPYVVQSYLGTNIAVIERSGAAAGAALREMAAAVGTATADVTDFGAHAREPSPEDQDVAERIEETITTTAELVGADRTAGAPDSEPEPRVRRRG